MCWAAPRSGGVKFHWQFKRNGTTSLFAALDVATGSVIGTCYRRHRAREFLDFLKVIEAHVPDDLDIHIVMDNYSTHKTAAVKAWLARRPHWHVHFTPTSASWINQVERWFEPPPVCRRLQSKYGWSLWKKVTEQTGFQQKCAPALFG